jgi:hypothetical protein
MKGRPTLCFLSILKKPFTFHEFRKAVGEALAAS